VEAALSAYQAGRFSPKLIKVGSMENLAMFLNLEFYQMNKNINKFNFPSVYSGNWEKNPIEIEKGDGKNYFLKFEK